MKTVVRLGWPIVLLAGCATEPPPLGSGILDRGGAFSITTEYPAANEGILVAQSEALGQARAFCSRQGAILDTLGDQSIYLRDTAEARFTVAFRCIRRGGTAAAMPIAPLPRT